MMMWTTWASLLLLLLYVTTPVADCYRFEVRTSRRDYAGTTANVQIEMEPSDRTGQYCSLILRGADMTPDIGQLYRGHHDVYEPWCPNTYGDPISVTISKDNQGQWPDWFLEKIVIYNDRDEAFTFDYHDWITDTNVHIMRSSETNLAFDRPTSQSSLLDVNNTFSWLAVDGNRYNNYCAATQHDDPSWWTVDLGLIAHVNRVVVRSEWKCPTGTGWEEFAGDCYYVSTSSEEALSWQNASIACQNEAALAHESKLASIPNAAVNSYLQNRLKQIKFDRAWIGLYRNSSVSTTNFVWIDEFSGSYKNWGSGKPSNTENVQVCGEIDISTGFWNDIVCNGESANEGFVCKANKAPSNYTVVMTYTPHETTPSNTTAVIICGQGPHTASDGDVVTTRCADDLPPARYVTLLDPDQPLVLCEVEVYGTPVSEMAIGKPTWNGSGVATDNHMRTLLCENSAVPCDYWWYAVDLGHLSHVTRMMVVNIEESSESPAISISGVTNNPPETTTPSLSDASENELCGYSKQGVSSVRRALQFQCVEDMRPGRYVFFMSRNARLMESCEVRVFGSRVEKDLALFEPTWQGSNQPNKTWAASSSAVDGDMNSNYDSLSCTEALNPGGTTWWAVDLGHLSRVRRVVVTNILDKKPDLLSEFVVGLTNSTPTTTTPTAANVEVCGRGPNVTGPGQGIVIQCNAGSPIARYVVILNPHEVLRLCEVQVFGESVDEKPILEWGFEENATPVQEPAGEHPGTTYIGCVDDGSAGLVPFKHLIYSDGNNSPERCVAACRQQGFNEAALKNGSECFCGRDNTKYANKKLSSSCTTPCTSRIKEIMCGGPNSSAVYWVPRDARYIGCFADRTDVPDVTFDLGSSTEQVSSSDCIDVCLEHGFAYAAMQNGSRCSCGNEFGRYGEVHYTQCSVLCSGRRFDACGGPTTNSIHSTEIGYKMRTNLTRAVGFRTLYSDKPIPAVFLDQYMKYPLLKSIITPKTVLVVSESVENPHSDSSGCESCYNACDFILAESTHLLNDSFSTDQTIRAFYIKFSQLKSLVSPFAKRVFVYAQTVLVDVDLTVPYSLLIRSRQLLLDRSPRRSIIQQESSVPAFDLDFTDRQNFGVFADTLFMKQSFACVKVLLERSHEQTAWNTAWAIMHDLIGYQPIHIGAEQSAWIASVSSDAGLLTGYDRHGERFVPYGSPKYYKLLLGYYKSLSENYLPSQDPILKALNNLLTDEYEVQTGVKVANGTIQTHIDALQAITNGVIRSSVNGPSLNLPVYDSTVSKTSLEISHIVFNDQKLSFDAALVEEKRLGRLVADKYVASVVYPCWSRLGQSIRYGWTDCTHAFHYAGNSMDDVKVNFERVMNMVYTLYTFHETADRVTALVTKGDVASSPDYSKYGDDLQATFGLKENVAEWATLKTVISTVLSKDHANTSCIAQDIKEYRRAMYDLCDKGTVLTQSAVEYAELLRIAMGRKNTLSTRTTFMDRLQSYTVKVAGVLASYPSFPDHPTQRSVTKEKMTEGLLEQKLDIGRDLYDNLNRITQACYFLKSTLCDPDVTPLMTDSLEVLNNKINQASETSAFDADISQERECHVITLNDADSVCDDLQSCPVTAFRNTHAFSFTLDIDDPGTSDMQRLRVTHVEVMVNGARSLHGGDNVMHTVIASTGEFHDEFDNVVHISTSLTRSMEFDYNVKSGRKVREVTFVGDDGNLSTHTTPFATWLIKMSKKDLEHIDISNVTSIQIGFKGWFPDARAKKNPSHRDGDVQCDFVQSPRK